MTLDVTGVAVGGYGTIRFYLHSGEYHCTSLKTGLETGLFSHVTSKPVVVLAS